MRIDINNPSDRIRRVRTSINKNIATIVFVGFYSSFTILISKEFRRITRWLILSRDNCNLFKIAGSNQRGEKLVRDAWVICDKNNVQIDLNTICKVQGINNVRKVHIPINRKVHSGCVYLSAVCLTVTRPVIGHQRDSNNSYYREIKITFPVNTLHHCKITIVGELWDATKSEPSDYSTRQRGRANDDSVWSPVHRAILSRHRKVVEDEGAREFPARGCCPTHLVRAEEIISRHLADVGKKDASGKEDTVCVRICMCDK